MPHAPAFARIGRALVILAAAASLAGCDIVVNTMEGGREKATDLWTRSYDMPEGAAVEVDNTNGKIEVDGSDGTTVEVKAEITVKAGTVEAAREILKQVEIREDKAAGRIRLETRYPKGLGRANVDVRYTLRVPRNAKLGLSTTNGGINVENIAGFVTAETTNGGIEGIGLAGGVKASTTNGSIDVAIRDLAAEGIALETTNGGIELAMPGGVKGTLSARVVNGGIKVAPELKIEKSESSRRRLEGTINGGGPAIRLETVNGGIRVSGQ
jgi:DUF4097 and DUF4098 domain-containing protein YvlB